MPRGIVGEVESANTGAFSGVQAYLSRRWTDRATGDAELKRESMTWGPDVAFGHTGARVELVGGDDVVDDRPIYVMLAEAGKDGRS
jgi:hypothetical protein